MTDQRGQQIAFSDLRERAVVLAFLDPRCTDICPLTAAHLRRARAALGGEAERVVLLAVNTNPDANTQADLREATARWGLDDVAAWHFLTGGPEELEQVWEDYFVVGGVEKPGKPGEVAHTSGVYIIDTTGRLRWFISFPEESETGGASPSFGSLVEQRLREVLARSD